MDRKTYFFQFLIVFGVLILTNGQIIAQESYGSRRIISPGHPLGLGPFVDSYSQGSVMSSRRITGDPYGNPYPDPYMGGGVLPVGGGMMPVGGGVLPVGGGMIPVGGSALPVYPAENYPVGGMLGGIFDGRRHPSIVGDRSSTSVQTINVSNKNNNHRFQTGSGNVVINQVSTNGRSCSCYVGMPDQCYPQVCIPDSSCSGAGGNGICGSGQGIMMI
ncbi:uncharacterized protein LOC132733979 [Ruditapes philippinarum]|uniref:uncharacterized protein LOC132733979 n=1 Tax=Ruditapes philippinarum TaxID=129788 RepID=UPI00295A6EB9|nr:uncharacterized protein LOC132733979 [Ruditapes philippinarum]